MKILFYACGGGIGHFNRAYSIARLLPNPISSLIVTSTCFLPPVHEEVNILRLPSVFESQRSGSVFADLLQSVFDVYQPDVLVVDTFMSGIQDELAPLKSRVSHPVLIARDPVLNTPGYHKVFNVSEHHDGLVLNRKTEELMPKGLARRALLGGSAVKGSLILAIHNGEPSETQSYFKWVEHALPPDSHLVRASLLPMPEASICSYFPISALLKGADLVLAGGGYNMVAETRAHEVPALYTPFERPVDQQYQRVQHLPHVLMGRSPSVLRNAICESLEAVPQVFTGKKDGAETIAQYLSGL